MMDTLFEIPETTKVRHRVRMMANARNNKTENDFYPTPEIATVKLLEVEKFAGDIWEPACGDGAMSRVFEAYGYEVRSTDLVDRGYGQGGVDFLRSTDRANNIVTNPPFSLANKFIHHALVHANNKVALLLRLNYLESRSRKKLFIEFPFARLYVFSDRVQFGSGQSTMAFGWFIWDYSYKSKPTIDWI